MGPLEISQLDSANMDWLLHFQKSQSSPTAPWLLNCGSQEGRGEAAICISHGASLPHCCWGGERGGHMTLLLAVYGTKMDWKENSQSIITGCHHRLLKFLFFSFCCPLYFPIFLLLCFLPSSFSELLQKADPAWLQALISRASELRVYWSGLQSTKQM